MIFVNSSKSALLDYVGRQLRNFFPDGNEDFAPVIERHADEALARLRTCIDAVRMWRVGEFDYLHSSQYTIFLYYLANTVWRNEKNARVCSKLFYLNKALNGIDLFYEIEMPEIFFIGHSVGIVLAKATYSNYLVLYQNSTVGKNHGAAPQLGEGVIMYPNTAIIGGCKVGARSVVAQGVSVVGRDTPGNCLCFQDAAGGLAFRDLNRDYVADFFRV